VAHAVVDVLEVVEIQEEDAGLPAVCRGARERFVQLHQELAPVRQAGERVVSREVLELARALLDLGFQLSVVLPRDRLRRAQAVRHLVEGDGQGIELPDAAARHGDARLAARETFRRAHQAAHRQHHAAHRARDRDQQEQEHRAAQPAEQRALPALLLGDRAQHLGGLAPGQRQGSRGLVVRVDAAYRRREFGVALREGRSGVLALDVGSYQQLAQPDDARVVCARLRQPVGAEHAHDARLVFGEQARKRLFPQRDGAHGPRPVAVQVAQVVEAPAELVQSPAGLDEVVAADDLAEHRPDAVERRLDALVQRLEFDVEFGEQPPAGVGRAHELGAELRVRRDLSLEPQEDGVVDGRTQGRDIGRARRFQLRGGLGLGRAALL
jgi:hypothetical protein